MTTAVQQMLNSFDALSDAEKHEAAREILRRVPESSDDLSEDDLTAPADHLFRGLDRGETADELEEDTATTANGRPWFSTIPLIQADGELRVGPEDEDRFVAVAHAAARARCDGRPLDRPIWAFKREVLAPLIEWCAARPDRVRACYVVAPRGELSAFVVGVSPRYDFALSAEIGDLESRLFDSGWRVVVRLLPDATPEDFPTYFNPEGAIEAYAQFATAQGQGES